MPQIRRLAPALLAFAALSSATCAAEERTIRQRMGAGNLVTHEAGDKSADLYRALKAIGLTMGRMDSYGWRDETRQPTVGDFDAAMLEAYRNGITPVVLLEYEGSYQTLDPPQPIGSYEDWFFTGRAYATRFRPGGTFAQEHGAGEFGATIFTAINEPDIQATIPHAAYRAALEGFADGVHSVDPALKVVPGGFATCNSDGDASFRGYGPAIAPLLQSGKLAGLDFHTYYNARWYPLDKGPEFSAQTCFDKARAALGITREIGFYATEFNVARDEYWDDDATIGRLFLTAVWDQLGVAGADGRPATELAFPWYLVDDGSIEGPGYAMAAGLDPWRPEIRATILTRVLALAGDMRITRIDKPAGLIFLEGERASLVVVHNRPGWRERAGQPLDLPLPPGTISVELWGHDGLRETRAATGGAVRFDALPKGETLMIRVLRDGAKLVEKGAKP